MTSSPDWLPPDTEPVLVLAPHPDDFECVAVTMNRLRESGRDIYLAVLTGGASGVDDGFCEPPTAARKAEIREAEQRESCRMFGLPDERLRFFYLEEDEQGHPFESDTSRAVFREILQDTWPGIVCLPHPDDSNAGHRRTYRMFRAAAEATRVSAVAFLNEDPKTKGMTTSLYMPFGEERAGWKAELLRCHRSQHERNVQSRGHGLDDRILQVNRAAAERLGIEQPYAEAFEVERWVKGARVEGLAA